MPTPELNGKATHKDFITPFDAHEQVCRQPHVEAETEPLSVHSGLEATEYEHLEYPKAVTHDPETGEPVIAENEQHEAELAEKAQD